MKMKVVQKLNDNLLVMLKASSAGKKNKSA